MIGGFGAVTGVALVSVFGSGLVSPRDIASERYEVQPSHRFHPPPREGLVPSQVLHFPVSLPLWSFVLGVGFSAAIGIFFGLFAASKAANLDPIEALRYE